MVPRFDVIGDVHGELPALEALGRELGYRVDDGWVHPEGRVLFFLGDLVDRGAHSLEAAELVLRLAAARRAFCVMGNHEYNLVAWRAAVAGYERPKRSNRPTTEDVVRRPGRWAPVLEFFKDLPVGVALPDLRLIHACWHRGSLAQVEASLGQPVRPAEGAADTCELLGRHVVLRSPFEPGRPASAARILAGLPGDTGDYAADIPHEDLIKGFEVAAPEPFEDNDGKPRDRIRAMWWQDGRRQVLDDRPQVFGHYWNLPPLEPDHMVPPEPSGHPRLRDWARAQVHRVPARGSARMTGEVVCVDYQGVTRVSNRACIGALRWPERDLVWASAPRTAQGGGED